MSTKVIIETSKGVMEEGSGFSTVTASVRSTPS